MEVSTEGRYQTPHVSIEMWSTKNCPEDCYEIPGMNIDRYPDPYTYAPMGDVPLEIGQKVFIHDMAGNGQWAIGYVIKKLKNEDGFTSPWWLIGSQHQTQMF